MKSKKCKCQTCIDFRKKHNFEYLQIYSLSTSLADYILPRLIQFRKHIIGYPISVSSFKEWKIILDKMIFAFKNINALDLGYTSKKYINIYNKVQEGLNLFSKYYLNLWL